MSRFSIYVTFVSFTGLTRRVDLTSKAILRSDDELELVRGLQGEENLHDFQLSNVDLEFEGDLTAPDTDGYRIIGKSPCEIYKTTHNGKSRLVFIGCVSSDGLRVNAEVAGEEITEVTFLSYGAIFKELMLGTYDSAYRTGIGTGDLNAEEAFALYILQTEAIPPNTEIAEGEDPETYLAPIELAITPTQRFTEGFLIPGDELRFERRFIFDSRMLSDAISVHTDTPGGWVNYEYKEGVNVPARWGTREYYVQRKTLLEILNSVCQIASNYYVNFPVTFPWPRFTVLNTEEDFPRLVAPGSVAVDAGACWHYRYVYLNSRSFLFVWHTQWKVEVFEVTNETTLESLDEYELPEDRRYVLEGLSRVPTLYGSPYRQSIDMTRPDRFRQSHPDYIMWTNVTGTYSTTKIFLAWLNARASGPGADPEDITHFEAISFDLTTGRFTPRESRANEFRMPVVGSPNDFANRRYFIPTVPSGGDIESSSWAGFRQQAYGAPAGPDPNAVWTEGAVNANLYTESTSVNQAASEFGGNYVRDGYTLFYSGQIFLDTLKFQFERRTIGDVLSLICVLTNSVPVFGSQGQDIITLKLLPREQENQRTLRIVDESLLLEFPQREIVRYVSREDAPQVEVPGLELSKAHTKAINDYYFFRYFHGEIELTTYKLISMDDEYPSWESDIQFGDIITLSRNVTRGEEVAENIQENANSITIRTRRKI